MWERNNRQVDKPERFSQAKYISQTTISVQSTTLFKKSCYKSVRESGTYITNKVLAMSKVFGDYYIQIILGASDITYKRCTLDL